MTEAKFQRQILGTLAEMRSGIEAIRKDISYLTEYVEDTKLTEGERKQLEESISKIKADDASDFVPWRQAKKN